MNKTFLIGNLARAVELKEMGGGRARANGLLAVSEYRKGEKTETEWVRIVLWDRMAVNAARYLGRGSRVAIVGRLRSRFYDRPRGEGTVRTLGTEVTVESLTYLSRPGARAGAGEAALPAPEAEAATEEPEAPGPSARRNAR